MSWVEACSAFPSQTNKFSSFPSKFSRESLGDSLGASERTCRYGNFYYMNSEAMKILFSQRENFNGFSRSEKRGVTVKLIASARRRKGKWWIFPIIVKSFMNCTPKWCLIALKDKLALKKNAEANKYITRQWRTEFSFKKISKRFAEQRNKEKI